MFAVLQTGGKQYKVSKGARIRVEKLDADVGGELHFAEVLLISDGDRVSVGRPFVEGVSVAATVLTHGRADKINIIKFRRRKHSQRQMGHRQSFTELEITNIDTA